MSSPVARRAIIFNDWNEAPPAHHKTMEYWPSSEERSSYNSFRASEKNQDKSSQCLQDFAKVWLHLLMQLKAVVSLAPRAGVYQQDQTIRGALKTCLQNAAATWWIWTVVKWWQERWFFLIPAPEHSKIRCFVPRRSLQFMTVGFFTVVAEGSHDSAP